MVQYSGSTVPCIPYRKFTIQSKGLRLLLIRMLSRSSIIGRRALARASLQSRNSFGFPAVVSRRQTLRYFSNNDDLKETLRKVKEEAENKTKEKTAESEKADAASQQQASQNVVHGPSAFSQGLDFAKKGFEFFVDNVKLAYEELVGGKKDSYVKRKIDVYDATPAKKSSDEEDEEPAEPKETGPSAIVLVKEQKNPWEQMKERLQDSPLIRQMLKTGKRVSKVAVETDLGKKVQNAGQNVRDKLEDAREFWETSQNPLVYTISGAWDTVAGATDESITIEAIRRLDSQFDKEEFLAEVRDNLVPKVIKAHLGGDIKTLREWCGEGVYNKLAADIRTRKNDKLAFDDNILNIDEMEAVFKVNDQDNVPYVVCSYQVQQINCIKKAGEIIEGGETEIKLKFYSIAFQQQFDEDEKVIIWKVADYAFGGDMPYF